MITERYVARKSLLTALSGTTNGSRNGNFRPIVLLSVRGAVLAMFYDPLLTGPEKTFEIINNIFIVLYSGKIRGRAFSDR